MKDTIKKSLIAWIVFSFTVMVFWVSYAIFLNINTVNPTDELTADLINNIINNQKDLDTRIIASWSTPSWAVMAFNLSSCPTGWSEYTLAYGRFIRWIDKSWTNIDPDWERVLWNIQNDEFKSHNHTATTNNAGWHSHTYQAWASNNWAGWLWWSPNWGSYSSSTAGSHSHIVTINLTGWAETRPDNVALLYCVKN